MFTVFITCLSLHGGRESRPLVSQTHRYRLGHDRPKSKRGHLNLGQRGHYDFALAQAKNDLSVRCPTL